MWLVAGVYYSQARYSEAGPLYVECLELRKRLLGHDHADVASSVNNLIILFMAQARLNETE